MKINTKKIATLVAMILLVSIVAVFAQPDSAFKNKHPGIGEIKDRGYQKWYVEPVLMGHGFAFIGDEYHILDVNVVNKTTEIRGHVNFAGEPYALNITGYDNQSLAGDVLTLPPRGTDMATFTQTVVGNISLSMSSHEGAVVSTGTLTMNGTDYKVLLTSPMKHARGMNPGKGRFTGFGFPR